jgi:hypothetical protein
MIRECECMCVCVFFFENPHIYWLSIPFPIQKSHRQNWFFTLTSFSCQSHHPLAHQHHHHIHICAWEQREERVSEWEKKKYICVYIYIYIENCVEWEAYNVIGRVCVSISNDFLWLDVASTTPSVIALIPVTIIIFWMCCLLLWL